MTDDVTNGDAAILLFRFGEVMDLADEVEKLDGPSREMDARIARALLVTATVRYAGGQYLGSSFDKYTASLDASASLVPDGCDWLVNSRCNFAHVWDSKESGKDGSWKSETAGNLPNAIIAAALRAIASEMRPSIDAVFT